ncbi:hypothetical protein GOP47_0015012 [Adiantum capillus-veneris]|uniref:RING-type E3 ubiquitin transferase n=1 Tax=Adiantum capillus-veneris TaxID=13818 RepID=A0A9D4UMK8_ADICA|nr:hypothetical protein GOP47_0015012 [Adiantum capillus-veneris]
MESSGNGIYNMANVNSSGSVTSAADGKGGSSFSPAVIAIVGILGTAFLLVSYYTMVAKFCRGGTGRRMGWTGLRRNARLNEDALQAAVAGQQEHEQGLEQTEIEAIPVVEFLRRARSTKSNMSGGGGGLECAVCLSEFEEAEHLRLLPSCLHAFHLPCIDVWLRSHASCPLCRTPIHSHLDLFDLAAGHGPRLDISGPTSPAAGSGHLTSPSLAASPAPYRLIPIYPGGHDAEDQNQQHNITRLPSSPPKLEALAHERVIRKGNLNAVMTPPMSKAQLEHLLLQGGQRAQMTHEYAGGARSNFPLGRCFSTGRSRGLLLGLNSNSTPPAVPTFHTNVLQDDAPDVQLLLPHSTLLSSPSPIRLSKHTGRSSTILMQRSSSYGVGSFFPIFKRQSPTNEQMIRKLSTWSTSKTRAPAGLSAVASSNSSLTSFAPCCCSSSSSFAAASSSSSSFSHDHKSVEHPAGRPSAAQVMQLNSALRSKSLNNQQCTYEDLGVITHGYYDTRTTVNASTSAANYGRTAEPSHVIPNAFKRSSSGGRL